MELSKSSRTTLGICIDGGQRERRIAELEREMEKPAVQNHEDIEAVFARLIQLPEADRMPELDDCGLGEPFKEQVKQLLLAHESQSLLLNQDLFSDIFKVDPTFFDSFSPDDELVFAPGDLVGNFEIDSLLGQGGMSTVYRAMQLSPVRRWVALKFIRPSVVAPRTIRRFLREQQALAMASHQNIAALYEVNKTDDGLPYAVMEFVDGMPITEFCTKHELDFRQRIELFTQICAAIQHSHDQEIVHRDVKPENVLVSKSGVQGIVKVIDFGIAKLSEASVGNDTMTHFGQILGSPRYMSPEQLAGAEVNSGTDIYSLGLVLFEILCGQPFRKGKSPEFWNRSTEATNPQDNRLSHHLARQTTRRANLRLARRAVDWIIVKCLSQNPAERYASAKELERDLTSALRNEPISVAPPQLVTRVKQTINRQMSSRPGVISLVALVLMLVAGAIATYATMKWQESSGQLSEAQAVNKNVSVRETAANYLMMNLMALQIKKVTPENLETNLIPTYQSQVNEINKKGGPTSDKERAAFGVLAVLYATAGEFDQADYLLDQTSSSRTDPEFEAVRQRICKQFAESLSKELESDEEFSELELAGKQLTLGRSYLYLKRYSESRLLLEQAVQYFDQHQPMELNCLVARSHLIQCLKRMKLQKIQLDILEETFYRFEKSDLLANERGKAEFKKVASRWASESSKFLQKAAIAK